MSRVPRSVPRRAAWTALAVLLLGSALGACASTVVGTGSLDRAYPVPLTSPAEPTAGPDSASATGTDQPTGTTGPTDTAGSTDTAEPTDTAGSSQTAGPTGGDPVGPAADRQAVAARAEAFYHGIAAKDGAGVCAMLTASAQKKAAEGSKDCASSLRETTLTAAQVAALRNVKVDPEKVSVTGDTAAVPTGATSVNGSPTSETGDLSLLRQDTDWKIDDLR